MKLDSNITIDIVEKQIAALKRLLYYYEFKERSLSRCPLCKVASEVSLENGDILEEYPLKEIRCRYCPWVWVTGTTCIKWCTKRGYLVSAGTKRMNDYQRKIRIKQIKRWIKTLEKFIEGIE